MTFSVLASKDLFQAPNKRSDQSNFSVEKNDADGVF